MNKDKTEIHLIESWNTALDAAVALAQPFQDHVEAQGNELLKDDIAAAVCDLVHAMDTGKAAVNTDKDGKPTKSFVPWNRIGDALALAYAASEEWPAIVWGIKTAFATYFPDRKWSGGYLQQVEHAGKKKRNVASDTDGRGFKWSNVAKKVDALHASLAKVKGPKKGKEFKEAQARVILLAAELGLTVK